MFCFLLLTFLCIQWWGCDRDVFFLSNKENRKHAWCIFLFTLPTSFIRLFGDGVFLICVQIVFSNTIRRIFSQAYYYDNDMHTQECASLLHCWTTSSFLCMYECISLIRARVCLCVQNITTFDQEETKYKCAQRLSRAYDDDSLLYLLLPPPLKVPQQSYISLVLFRFLKYRHMYMSFLTKKYGKVAHFLVPKLNQMRNVYIPIFVQFFFFCIKVNVEPHIRPEQKR